MNILKTKWLWLSLAVFLLGVAFTYLTDENEQNIQIAEPVVITPSSHTSVDLTPEQMTKKQQLPVDQQNEYEQNIADRQSVDKVRLNQQQALKTLQGGEQKFKDLDAKAEAIIKKLKEGSN